MRPFSGHVINVKDRLIFPHRFQSAIAHLIPRWSRYGLAVFGYRAHCICHDSTHLQSLCVEILSCFPVLLCRCVTRLRFLRHVLYWLVLWPFLFCRLCCFGGFCGLAILRVYAVSMVCSISFTNCRYVPILLDSPTPPEQHQPQNLFCLVSEGYGVGNPTRIGPSPRWAGGEVGGISENRAKWKRCFDRWPFGEAGSCVGGHV